MREGFKGSPTVPINNGSAGLAFALHRIACATGDGELHAAADAWSTRSLRAIESPAAFESENQDPQALKIGPASLHHHRPGVYAAEALIASARGDFARQSHAADQFVAWGSRASKDPEPKPEPIIDLTIGLSGSLLGAALLLDSFAEPGLPQDAMESQARLLAFGRDLYVQLWNILDSYARIGESPGLADTGMAHGWAGILYASLCWHSASGGPLPSSVHDRLDQLAVLAEPFGRGLQWPWGTRALVPGWCNGTAGQVFLWTQANQATGDHRYLALAEGAAWNNWETPSRFHSPLLWIGRTGIRLTELLSALRRRDLAAPRQDKWQPGRLKRHLRPGRKPATRRRRPVPAASTTASPGWPCSTPIWIARSTPECRFSREIEGFLPLNCSFNAVFACF